jgi:hypothetical protein
MSGDRLAVYTTVYPGVEPYLADWYRSVQAQTDRGFDLWIGVDGLSPEAVTRAMGAEPAAAWVSARPGESGTGVRARAIALMADAYEAVVFVDSDDLLEPSRVAAARAALAGCDVVGCALQVIDRNGVDLGIVFGVSEDADLGSLLPRHNVLGLSNTAYRSSVLRRCLPVPEHCVLLDWLLGTRAWASGARVYFDPTPRMLYRQYEANVARVLVPFDAEYVLRATQRVLEHYDCVLDSQWELPAGPRQAVAEACRRVRAFHATVSGSAAVLERYVDALNALPPRYVWWWCVANAELEAVWRN